VLSSVVAAVAAKETYVPSENNKYIISLLVDRVRAGQRQSTRTAGPGCFCRIVNGGDQLREQKWLDRLTMLFYWPIPVNSRLSLTVQSPQSDVFLARLIRQKSQVSPELNSLVVLDCI
jgi:hypothetical protein